MARKEIDITITEEGRDKGKVFHIREMGAFQAEESGGYTVLEVRYYMAPLRNHAHESEVAFKELVASLGVAGLPKGEEVGELCCAEGRAAKQVLVHVHVPRLA